MLPVCSESIAARFAWKIFEANQCPGQSDPGSAERRNRKFGMLIIKRNPGDKRAVILE